MALPFLESLAAAGSTPSSAVPMRMLCVGNNFGFVPKLFFPTETGADYAMPELLKTFEPHRKELTPPIEPDTRGTTTIRDQLARHREVAACADCHAKIDPWGFALESYGPIGGWRTHYPRSGNRGQGPEVDPSATLPTGQEIADAKDLRDALLERKDQVLRNLIRQ